MIIERSKTEGVLSIGGATKISFMKEFVKPPTSSGFPRLSKSTNLTESSNITTENQPPTTTGETADAAKAVPEGRQSAAATKGFNYRTQPLLAKRSRATFFTFHSPFETGAVRVAASAPAPPVEKPEAKTLIHSTPYGWVPPIIYAAPELPSRLEPIHPLPPAPQRQHTGWETVDGHWRNDQRAAIMRRLQHINSNEMLAKCYYGSSDEINNYKRHMRGILKQQMEEQWVKSRKFFHLDLSEANAAIEYDRQCQREDQDADRQKRVYLHQFACDNRRLADEKRVNQAQERQREIEHERRLLTYNPINWSGTLS